MLHTKAINNVLADLGELIKWFLVSLQMLGRLCRNQIHEFLNFSFFCGGF